MRTLRVPLGPLFVPSLFVCAAQAQVPSLVDVTSVGHAPQYGARDARISPDGRWVVFVSESKDLVAGDTNGGDDIFLADRSSGSIVRASVATGGAETHPFSTSFANFYVASPAVSRDGRFVAFASNAPDLVAGDTNYATDVFVRDVIADKTERVSVSTSGAETTGNSGAYGYMHFGGGVIYYYERASGLAISSDGRFVAFARAAANPGGSALTLDIYLRDRATSTTELVSQTTDGAPPNAPCWFPSMSDDGRYVAFDSTASNLVVGDTNNANDVFVRDRELGGHVSRQSRQ
jgi:Tol biopolymer transport system component